MDVAFILLSDFGISNFQFLIKSAFSSRLPCRLSLVPYRCHRCHYIIKAASGPQELGRSTSNRVAILPFFSITSFLAANLSALLLPRVANVEGHQFFRNHQSPKRTLQSFLHSSESQRSLLWLVIMDTMQIASRDLSISLQECGKMWLKLIGIMP
ncbi:hypothetical protein K1719_001004 [Acacia pycnantha]|nr:hypothetical protein K1719_001004 [Acacia pycnantha]